MNGYSRDLLQERVAVAKRYEEQSQTFGGSSTVTKYEWLNKAESDHGFWCKHDWTRGLKAMHEGALDAYDIVTFRMDFDPAIDRWCLLLYEGKWYQIQNLNGSQRENKLQIQAIEMANQNVVVMRPLHEIEIWANYECTERPNGLVDKVYAQFNTNVYGSATFENEDFTFKVNREALEGEYFAFDGLAFYRHFDKQTSVTPAGTVMELDSRYGRSMDGSKNYSFGDFV